MRYLKFLIFIFFLLQCNIPSFIKNENSSTSEKVTIETRYNQVYGRIAIPSQLNDALIGFDLSEAEKLLWYGDLKYKQDWDEDLGYKQDWDEELGYKQDWDEDVGYKQDWDEDVGYKQDWDEDVGYKQDWDENIDGFLREAKLSLSSLGNDEVIERGAIPVSSFGRFGFILNKELADNNYLQLSFSSVDADGLNALVVPQKPVLISTETDFAYKLLTRIIIKNRKNEELSLVTENRERIFTLYQTISDLALKQNKVSGATDLRSLRLSFGENFIKSEDSEKLIKLVTENTTLNQAAALDIINSVLLEKVPLTNGTEVASSDDGPFNLAEEKIDKFPENKNRWILIDLPKMEFFMGSEETESSKPVHKVTLSPYKILKYEVSVDLFKKCYDEKSCDYKPKETNSSTFFKNQGGKPMNFITWTEARQFCNWLGGDLPTEAEWEFAARGPGGRKFTWGNTFSEEEIINTANTGYPGDGFDSVAPVGSFGKDVSVFGVYDMNGNISEWCQDYFDTTFYSKTEATSLDPVNNNVSASRIARGGSSDDGVQDLFLFARDFGRVYLPEEKFPVIGMRCTAKIAK